MLRLFLATLVDTKGSPQIRILFGLGVQDKFVPKRYFSIDRVFRNEAVDRTHLAEFHQIEGMPAFLLL